MMKIEYINHPAFFNPDKIMESGVVLKELLDMAM